MVLMLGLGLIPLRGLAWGPHFCTVRVQNIGRRRPHTHIELTLYVKGGLLCPTVHSSGISQELFHMLNSWDPKLPSKR